MTDVIDLRSDTVTRPTPDMLKAMMEAPVGDDVYGEDPTVNALQEEVAELFGKEAALFVPTGTMANQVSLKAHTQAGDGVIAHPMAHILRAEGGGGGMLSGIQFHPVGEADGSLQAEQVEAAMSDGSNPHFQPTGLVCMENTHNFAGGTVIPLETLAAVEAVARRHKVPMHLDGARVLNAAVALDVQPERITRHFDSTTLCFSKGLGTPVGSAIAGSKDFIRRCVRFRKMYGGGMRQAGYLAAAARYALKHHVQRLADDHANARRLAEGLAASEHITLMYGMPQTNIIFFELHHPRLDMPAFVKALGERGVLLGGTGAYAARMVTHLGVDAAGIDKAVAAVHDVLRG